MMRIPLPIDTETTEKNDEQILLRLPVSLKTQIETATKLEGMTHTGMDPQSSILSDQPPQRLPCLRYHQHLHREIL